MAAFRGGFLESNHPELNPFLLQKPKNTPKINGGPRSRAPNFLLATSLSEWKKWKKD